MSDYYKKLYFGQVENNQIMSKEIKRLENNNKALKKMIQRDRDEVLNEMESINNQYLTELFIQQNKIYKAIEYIDKRIDKIEDEDLQWEEIGLKDYYKELNDLRKILGDK